MDVDVDLARIEGDEQGDDRMAITLEEIGVGGANRAEEELVAYRPAVDEEELSEAVGAAIGRQPGETPKGDPFSGRVDRKSIRPKIGADDGGDASEAGVVAGRGG